MIRYDAFGKSFGGVVAVRDLDLEIGRGEAVALIGPNGCGKTTTLKAALGLVRPTHGRVRVAGLDVATHGAAVRASLGYLPQRLSFPEGTTAREVLRFYGRLRGVDAAGHAALLERVGLADAADRAADGYSGGMRQRLGIAVALLGDPRALVLDEPTAALDPSGALVVRDILDGLRADGMTVLLSSHDLAEVAAVAGRVGVLLDGRLAALGSPTELARALGLPARLRVALAAGAPLACAAAERAGACGIAWEDGVLRCEVQPGREAAVLEALREAGAAVSEIALRIPDLEDVYRALAAPARRVA